MNRDLLALFQADQDDHQRGLRHDEPGYPAMRRRDRERRHRVAEILAEADDVTPKDRYRAAWILHHGDAPDDAWQAHALAKRAAADGHRPARWLAAAAFDRWRMYRGEPQRYGTQFVPDGTRHRLWDVEPDTTDAERAAWDVPPLAAQRRRAEEMTRANPPPPIGDDAPQWLKDAVERWKVGPDALPLAVLLAGVLVACGPQPSGTPCPDRLVLHDVTVIDGLGNAPAPDRTGSVEAGKEAGLVVATAATRPTSRTHGASDSSGPTAVSSRPTDGP